MNRSYRFFLANYKKYYDKIKGRFKGVYSAGYRADGWVSLS